MTKYFYGPQSDLFSFYRIPKILFQHDKYKNLSAEAKILYGLLLSRMDLSAKNGWVDDEGRVYIIYTVEEIMEKLNCGNKKACQLLLELESKANLIERRRQGLGKPNLIYVLNFMDMEVSVERHFLKCQNDTSGSVIMTPLEMSKGHGSNNDISNTENSDIDSFSSGIRNESDSMQTFKQYEEYFRKSLDLDTLCQDTSLNQEELHAMVYLLTEVCASKRKTIRINKEEMPIEVVRSRFMQMTSQHLRYAMMTMHNNTTRVRDMKQYMLAVLFNAPITISSYYQNWVNHDMAEGLI